MTGPRYYRLRADHSVEPFPVRSDADLIAWSTEVFGGDRFGDRCVASTEVAPGVSVSTVFLGLDRSFGRTGPPLVFETMAFDADRRYQWRWSTWDEAVVGHEAALAMLRARLMARNAPSRDPMLPGRIKIRNADKRKP